MATTKTTKNTKNTKVAKTTKKKGVLGPIIGAIIAAIVIIAAVIGVTVLVDHLKGANRAGTYILSNIYLDGAEEDSIDLVNALGLKASIELRDDDTCSVDIFGETDECTYNDNEIILEGTTTPYTYKNKSLTFEQGGNKMTFTREDQ